MSTFLALACFVAAVVAFAITDVRIGIAFLIPLAAWMLGAGWRA